MRFYAGRASERGLEHGDQGQDNLPQERTLLNDVVAEGVEISRSVNSEEIIERKVVLAGEYVEMANRLKGGASFYLPNGYHLYMYVGAMSHLAPWLSLP